MKLKVGYNIDKLITLFPCYTFKRITTVHEGEEHYKELQHCYIAYPEINRVHFWEGTFSNTQTVFSDEGEEAHAHSKNINVNDTTLLRINDLIQISPILTMIDDKYVEATEDLNAWIIKNSIECSNYTQEYLNDIVKTFCVENVMTFRGCWSPVKTPGGGWAYSSQDLTLSGEEYIAIGNAISDECLKRKVKCILEHYGTKHFDK